MPQASGYLQIAEQSSVLSGRQDAALYGSQDGRRYAKHIQIPALLLGINARADPIEVALVARGDGQHDELRRVVRMFGNDEFLERLEFRLGGFENDQHLGARLNLVLPPIVRFDSGNLVRAGDETGFEGRCCQTAARLDVWRGDER